MASDDPDAPIRDERVDPEAPTEPAGGANVPEAELAPAEAESREAPTVPIPALADIGSADTVPALDEPVPAGDPLAPSKPRKRPLLRARFVIIGLLLIGVAVYLLQNAPRWIHDKTIAEARIRGIELTLGSVDLDWDRVQLKHFEFSLIGVPGVRGRVELLQVDLDELTPTRVGARGVRLDVEGSAAALAMTISEWTKTYPTLLLIPAKASAVDVRWRPQPGEPEWLSIENAVIEPTINGGTLSASKVQVFDLEIGFDDATIKKNPSGASVTASQVSVAGVELGNVGTSWSGDLSHIQLGFGEQDLAHAPVTIDVAYAQPEPKATILLRPTPLERLAAPLGVALPIEGVTASGTAELRFGQDPTQGAITGQLQGTFEGYAPPVPKEVSSFVFGETTYLRTDLRISDDRKVVELSNTRAEHGAIKLTGAGRIDRHPTHAAIELEMKGSLRCTDLADAAARAQVGGVVGGLLGSAARLAVRGSVAVKLKIEADTRNLAAAKLHKTIGIGCGLKSLGELPIPKLPNELPKLPDLPSFRPKGTD